MNDEKKGGDSKAIAQEFVQVFRRGVQFTEELVAENGKLRFQLAKLEQDMMFLSKESSNKEILERMRSLEHENLALQKMFSEIESKNQEYENRHLEMETEYDRIANLYVVSYQMHSTLDLQEIVRISFEILVNLIGAQRFALYILDAQQLVPVLTEGVPIQNIMPIQFGQAPFSQTPSEQKLFVSDKVHPDQDLEPLACVPLHVSEQLLGMFVVNDYLPHKQSITDLDHELFRLLATHAGMALYAAALTNKVGAGGRNLVEVLRSIAN